MTKRRTQANAMTVDEALLVADGISLTALGGTGALSALVLLAAEVRRQHGEVESLRVQLAHWKVFGLHADKEWQELRRWRSTHAPRLDALQGLLHTAQIEADAGREAVATLASERAANALLTDEVERLRAALGSAQNAAITGRQRP